MMQPSLARHWFETSELLYVHEITLMQMKTSGSAGTNARPDYTQCRKQASVLKGTISTYSERFQHGVRGGLLYELHRRKKKYR